MAGSNGQDQALLESLMQENREFSPPPQFAKQAWVKDMTPYEEAEKDYTAFWAKHAENELSWFRKWDQVLDESNKPFYKWFVGGQLNIAYNCIDRHVEGGKGNKPAIVWEGEPGETRTLTYADLQQQVGKFANVLKSLGVQKGDRVAIYMGMVPELPIAMLACARIGAPHTVVFGGFSSDALKGRINDAEAKVVITQDGSWRRGSVVPLK
ncbi:MAG: AMP-binding protein, partial [Rudaea sp.]